VKVLKGKDLNNWCSGGEVMRREGCAKQASRKALRVAAHRSG
jgi:hypothetical protein